MFCLCDVNERSRAEGGSNLMAGVLNKKGTRKLTNIHARFICNFVIIITTLSLELKFGRLTSEGRDLCK